MLSYHAIMAPQPGQAERGCTRLRRSGTRAITTFRKLPITNPMRTTATATMPAPDSSSVAGREKRSRRPGGPGRREVCAQLGPPPYGQAVGAPPLRSAPVLSPVPQMTNVPAAVVVYLYDVPEPPQPAGSVGVEFRNGPPTWFCALVCWVSRTDGRAPLCAVAEGQGVAVEPLSGRPPQCAE